MGGRPQRGAEGIPGQGGPSKGVSVETHTAPGQPRGWGAGADRARGAKPARGVRAAHTEDGLSRRFGAQVKRRSRGGCPRMGIREPAGWGRGPRRGSLAWASDLGRDEGAPTLGEHTRQDVTATRRASVQGPGGSRGCWALTE